MKLDPIPALIATDERVEKAIREAPNWSSYADKISYMEKELEAAREVVEAARRMEGWHGIFYGITEVRAATKKYDEAMAGAMANKEKGC